MAMAAAAMNSITKSRSLTASTLFSQRPSKPNRRAIISRGSGGLSGAAIKPLALHAVWQVAAEVHIPVIGIGGIMTPGDALEFLLAGATAVQLGTVNYVRPQAAAEIHDGIAAYMVQHGLTDMRALPIRSVSVLTHV